MKNKYFYRLKKLHLVMNYRRNRHVLTTKKKDKDRGVMLIF